MIFVDPERAKSLRILKDAHYEFPRAQKLKQAFEWMFTDYFVNAAIHLEHGKGFEARALLAVGSSRVGKTTDLNWVRMELNQSQILMPDGRAAKMIKVLLRGISSWKDLGVHTLNALGIPSKNSSNQTQIWELVAFHAQAHGVVCIHYDECQHIFSRKSEDTQANIIDCFKSILKQPTWPLMLVFSGVQELQDYILQEEQLAYLVKTVTFNDIDPTSDEDLIELNRLCFAFADKIGIDFAQLSNSDFHQRLAYACADRWGLVIELLIEALVLAKSNHDKMVRIEHFCDAFTGQFELKKRHSPFSIENYEGFFESEAILRMWNKNNHDS